MKTMVRSCLVVLFLTVVCLYSLGEARFAPVSLRPRHGKASGLNGVDSLKLNEPRVFQRNKKVILWARGGAWKKEPPPDSNLIVTLKTAAVAALQTGGLLGFIRLGESDALADFLTKLKIPSLVFGFPVARLVSIPFVIFSSSTVKSWIQGGMMSAATRQLLKPDVIPGDSDWYNNLKKPWFNPPGWVFPIMWLLVSKPTQALAVSKVLKNQPVPYWPALTVYCAHLSLGDAWNDIFFGYQRVGLGVGFISTFFGLLLTSTKLFANVDESAGKFMLPTCGWVSVATALNWSIFLKNRD